MALDGTLRPPISPVQPGAYSAVDATALQGQGAPQAPVVCLLGAAAGGTPNTMYLFRDVYSAKNRLRSGIVYDMARFAFAGGAGLVGVVRVGNAIAQSTIALVGTGGTAITLTSLDYGAWTNGIKATVAANNNVTVSFTDANGVTYNEVYALGAAATAQNIADAINGKLAGYPTPSQYVSAAVGVGTAPLTVAAQTPLAGGSDGSVVAGDWTTGLAAIEPEGVDYVVAGTGDATIHAQVLAHCNNMSSSIARKERRTVEGGILGESVTTVIARMAALHDKRIQLAYPGMQDFDSGGVLKTWDPFYVAAKLAGMHAALPDPATSLTHAPFPTVDLEQQSGKYLSTLQGGDIDQLLRAGVTPITPAGSGGGFWIVDSLSGWNADDSFRDFHKAGAADAVAVRLRTRLEAKYVGKKALDSTQNDIDTDATAELEGLKLETIIRAYQDVQVTQGADARTWIINAPVLLPEATKFLMITVALQPSSAINREVPASADALL